jgi:hypothetical protein
MLSKDYITQKNRIKHIFHSVTIAFTFTIDGKGTVSKTRPTSDISIPRQNFPAGLPCQIALPLHRDQ